MKNNADIAKINTNVEIFFKIILIAVFALILPIILIPVVKASGYSEVIEEIVKALVVLFLILKLPTIKFQISGAILFGLLFGLSENIFYLTNIFQVGDFSIFWQRFLWPVPMHIITVLIIWFSGFKNKYFIIFGLIAAIILHICFNNYVTQIL